MLAGTALVGGVALSAAKRGSRARRQRHDGGPLPEPDDRIEQIKELNELREQGILTDEEFTAEKKKLLGI